MCVKLSIMKQILYFDQLIANITSNKNFVLNILPQFYNSIERGFYKKNPMFFLYTFPGMELHRSLYNCKQRIILIILTRFCCADYIAMVFIHIYTYIYINIILVYRIQQILPNDFTTISLTIYTWKQNDSVSNQSILYSDKNK